VPPRHVLSLLCAVLLLRLNFVAVDLACARHEAAATAAVDTHGHSTMDHAQHDPSSRDEPCEAPVRADCCAAFVSCSVVLSADAATTAEGIARNRPVRFALGSGRPGLNRAAPEPPPPKA
jgi:hypothetical protein